MHVCPALVVCHGLAVEDGCLLAHGATLWLCLFPWCGRLWFVVLVVVRGMLLDAVEKGGLVFAVPGSPRADVGAVAVDDVEVALVFSLALEEPFLGVGGPDRGEGCKGVLCRGVECAEDGGCVWVDGGVSCVSEDGVCEVLCVESVVGHGLLFNVACECILILEAVSLCKWVLWAL